jgi:hypothetical protein
MAKMAFLFKRSFPDLSLGIIEKLMHNTLTKRERERE